MVDNRGVHLPSELLPNVLRYLSVEECVSLGGMGWWRGLVQDPRVWAGRRVKIADRRWLAHLKTSSFVCKAEHLDLAHADINDDDLVKISKCFSHIKAINLANNRQLTDIGLEAMLKRHASHLKVLDLSRCFRLTNRTLECIAQQCTRLKDLNLTGCLFSTAGLKMLCEEQTGKTLQKLVLSRCHLINPEQLPLFLSMLSKIKMLDLSQLDGLMPYQCEATIGCLASLRTLNIIGCPEFTLRNVRSLESKAPHLTISHDARLEDHTVDAIRRYLLGLVTL